MKTKNLASLVVLGLVLGTTATYLIPQHSTEHSAPIASQRPSPVIPRKAVQEVIPGYRSDNSDFVFKKEFRTTRNTAPLSFEHQVHGYILSTTESLNLNVPSVEGVLGLIIDARAFTPSREPYDLPPSIQREKPYLFSPLENTPPLQLEVFWDGRRAALFRLTERSWRRYFCRVDGDGKGHTLTLSLTKPEDPCSSGGLIKSLALFSQDADPGGNHLSIGLKEARLRASVLNRRIVLLGLDGLSWKILDPLFEGGQLPELKQLLDQGVRATIADEPPLDSVRIWTTIATGHPPEVHGIDKRVYGNKDRSSLFPATSQLRKSKTLWQYISAFGRTVGFVNWFVSWPAEAVNGFIVTDRARYNIPRTVYPEFLSINRSRFEQTEENLLQDTSDYALKLKTLRLILQENGYPSRNPVEREEFAAMVRRLEEVYYNDGYYFHQGLELLSHHQPDVFALYLPGTDAISHAFYKFRFPEEDFDVLPEQLRLVGDPIADIYRQRDGYLGQLIKAADPETNWIILSDHGFQRQDESPGFQLSTRFLYDMNTVLESLGLLNFKPDESIDFESSVCYTSRQPEWYPVSHIRMVRRCGEQEKSPSAEEFITERDRTVRLLRSVVLGQSEKSVFHVEAIDRDDRQHDIRVYPVLSAADFEDSIQIAGHSVPAAKIFTVAPLSGTHHPEGIVILSGPGFRSGVQLNQRVHPLDIAPTLLALAGLPIGEDMIGQVLVEAIEPGFLHEAPVRKIPSYESLPAEARNRKELTNRYPELDQRLLQNYRDLGYIGN